MDPSEPRRSERIQKSDESHPPDTVEDSADPEGAAGSDLEDEEVAPHEPIVPLGIRKSQRTWKPTIKGLKCAANSAFILFASSLTIKRGPDRSRLGCSDATELATLKRLNTYKLVRKVIPTRWMSQKKAEQNAK